MAIISIKHNLNDLARMLDDVQRRQVPFASMTALNKVAEKVRAATYVEMGFKFDRPTPMVMKSLRIQYAKKTSLTAAVLLKDKEIGGKNPNSMAEIIGQQFTGGSRTSKRLEKMFIRAGLISAWEYLVPGADAKLDQYGNMSRGQIMQIISQLKLGSDRYSWSTKSVRSKRNVAQSGEMFWSRGGHLARGVWMRHGRSVSPILMASKKPHYQRRIDLDTIAQKVVDDNFEEVFWDSLNDALRTARP